MTAVTVRIKTLKFFVRIALEADLGLAKSYIAGEWDVVTADGADGEVQRQTLTNFLQLLIDNMPSGTSKTSG